MPRFARLLPVVVCAVSAAALAPAATFGATPKHAPKAGTVLSAAHHSLRLVDRGHRVTDVTVGTTRGLHRGDLVTVRGGKLRVTGRTHRIAFLGRVVRSSARATVLRLGDGSTFKLGKQSGRRGRSARAASTLTVDVQGLAAGQTILVTIVTDDEGNTTITIKVVSAATDIGDVELQVQGTITDDAGEGSFAIRTDDGRGLRFSDPQRLFEATAAEWCDTVEVTYRADGRRMVVDALRVTGTSDEGICAEDESWDEGEEYDGIVTAIAGDVSSLTLDPGDGEDEVTIPVEDETVLDGVSVGDDVAVITDEDGFAIEIDVFDFGEDPSDDDEDW